VVSGQWSVVSESKNKRTVFNCPLTTDH